MQRPTLSTKYNISEADMAYFTKNGHVLLPNVLTKTEIEYYRPVINQAAYQYNTETRQIKDRDTYGRAFLQIMNLWEVDADVRHFTWAKRMAGIAAALLGVKKVRLYHDQALYKEPLGGHTPWHQDQYYWPLDTTNTITMWMPLIDITEEMGMLTFASGSHTAGFVGNLAISDDSETVLETLVQQKKYPITRPQQMYAGDATWHRGWTLHHAPANASIDTTREVMTIIYFADGAAVTIPQNHHQEADRQRWLSGIEPGQMADSELNPVLG
jgi:ectoine hydroxylase-related dioxygenase (phytanoyl-CoA dioxygenase family)